MECSRFLSVILTILIVIASYILYKPGIEIPVSLKATELWNNFITYFNPVDQFESKDDSSSNSDDQNSELLFTANELKQFSGESTDKIYLSILGKVFDVSKGKKYYGVGKTYHGFAGRDASKAFVTGNFTEEGLIDDISDLKLNELGDLKDWVQKYEKDYTYKGKLIGRFYDKNGKPTKYLKDIEHKFTLLNAQKKNDEFFKKNYPPCNAEWTPSTGSRVWCSHLSGGIKRDWIGFPRKFHQPGSGVTRCACVNLKSEESKLGNFELYENCDPNAISCYV
ncbi:neuferricin [Halyomorpha halys]|uniref:neuferricin n=1 Tax=Halyomorpha halys TaxID=286706 RepID=UPI0006D4CE4E|nr:neuferricin [Halyomorpha halys]